MASSATVSWTYGQPPCMTLSRSFGWRLSAFSSTSGLPRPARRPRQQGSNDMPGGPMPMCTATGDVELLREREVRLVGRVGEREAAYCAVTSPSTRSRARRERVAQDVERRQRDLLRAADAGGRDDAVGRRVAPARRGRETVAVAAAHDALHDVQPLHLGEAGAAGAPRRSSTPGGRPVAGFASDASMARVGGVGVQVDVDDRLAVRSGAWPAGSRPRPSRSERRGARQPPGRFRPAPSRKCRRLMQGRYGRRP